MILDPLLLTTVLTKKNMIYIMKQIRLYDTNKCKVIFSHKIYASNRIQYFCSNQRIFI